MLCFSLILLVCVCSALHLNNLQVIPFLLYHFSIKKHSYFAPLLLYAVLSTVNGLCLLVAFLRLVCIPIQRLFQITTLNVYTLIFATAAAAKITIPLDYH